MSEKVFRRRWVIEEVKIPEGYVKCKVCKGSGEVRLYYGQPWDWGQLTSCWHCAGRGYIDKRLIESERRLRDRLVAEDFGLFWETLIKER
jgi:hypothetical protein